MTPGRSTVTVAAAALALVLALALIGCGGGSSSGSGEKTGGAIDGAGATAPQPLYEQWAKRFKARTGTTVNYAPVGSGDGIAQFVAGTADFGATDVAMNAAELRAAAKKGRPVHVPTALGAVAVTYRVPGLGPGLRLDGATLAGLFLGRIRRWDDRRIRALNPGRRLPGVRVAVVHRGDDSGTTQLFTAFLSAASPEWSRRVGSAKAVAWPVGAGAAGNAGVARAVRRTGGAVGFVALPYAVRGGLATASLRNRAGAYVAPSVQSTAAGASGRPADPGAYPIASPTFLLVFADMCKGGRSRNAAQLVDNWLHYVLTTAQAAATGLQYAPLPAGMLAAARASVARLRCNGALLKPRT